LFDAVRRGRLDTVRDLIANKANVNATETSGVYTCSTTSSVLLVALSMTPNVTTIFDVVEMLLGAGTRAGESAAGGPHEGDPLGNIQAVLTAFAEKNARHYYVPEQDTDLHVARVLQLLLQHGMPLTASALSAPLVMTEATLLLPRCIALAVEHGMSTLQRFPVETADAWRASLCIASILDAKDDAGCWYPAMILKVRRDQLLVHFVGWSHIFNEWLPRESHRLEPSGQRTRTSASSLWAVTIRKGLEAAETRKQLIVDTLRHRGLPVPISLLLLQYVLLG